MFNYSLLSLLPLSHQLEPPQALPTCLRVSGTVATGDMLDLMTQHAWIVFIRNLHPPVCEAGARVLAPMWFARASETPPAISAKVNGELLKVVFLRSREKDKGGAVGGE